MLGSVLAARDKVSRSKEIVHTAPSGRRYMYRWDKPEPPTQADIDWTMADAQGKEEDRLGREGMDSARRKTGRENSDAQARADAKANAERSKRAATPDARRVVGANGQVGKRVPQPKASVGPLPAESQSDMALSKRPRDLTTGDLASLAATAPARSAANRQDSLRKKPTSKITPLDLRDIAVGTSEGMRQGRSAQAESDAEEIFAPGPVPRESGVLDLPGQITNRVIRPAVGEGLRGAYNLIGRAASVVPGVQWEDIESGVSEDGSYQTPPVMDTPTTQFLLGAAPYALGPVGKIAAVSDAIDVGRLVLDKGVYEAGRELMKGMGQQAAFWEEGLDPATRGMRGLNALLIGLGATVGGVHAWKTGNRAVAAMEIANKHGLDVAATQGHLARLQRFATVYGTLKAAEKTPLPVEPRSDYVRPEPAKMPAGWGTAAEQSAQAADGPASPIATARAGKATVLAIKGFAKATRGEHAELPDGSHVVTTRSGATFRFVPKKRIDIDEAEALAGSHSPEEIAAARDRGALGQHERGNGTVEIDGQDIPIDHVVYLSENWDGRFRRQTVGHEAAHAAAGEVRRSLGSIIKAALTPDEIRNAVNYFGNEESFAQGVEAYVRTGRHRDPKTGDLKPAPTFLRRVVQTLVGMREMLFDKDAWAARRAAAQVERTVSDIGSGKAFRGTRKQAGAAGEGGNPAYSLTPKALPLTPKSLPWSQFTDPRNPELNLSRRKKVERLGDLESAKNPRMVFESSDGKVWVLGRDKTVDDFILEQDRNLTPQQVAEYRQWYAKQLPSFVDRGYDARALAADAAANQNVSTDVARGNMFRVMDQNAGLNNPGQAGLADANVRSVLSRQPVSPGPKLTDFIDANLGSKTRAYVGRNPEGGQPFVVDLHTASDAGGYVSPVILDILTGELSKRKPNGKATKSKAKSVPPDRWSKGRLNGQAIKSFEVNATNAEGKPLKVTFTLDDGTQVPIAADFEGGVPNSVPYEQISAKGNAWAEELNRRGYAGGGWSPEQVQAQGWMNMLHRRGENIQSPEWTWERVTSRNPVEANYDFGSLIKQAYPSLKTLPPDVQAAITTDVVSKAARDLSQLIGGSLRVQNATPGIGHWGGGWNPTVIIEATGSRFSRDVLADALAMVGEQKGVFSYTFERGNKHAVFFQTVDGAPIADDLFMEFAKANPQGVDGATKTAQGWMVAALSMRKADRIEKAFIEWANRNSLADDVAVSRIRHDVRYYEHDWQADPSGQGHRQRLRHAGGVGLERRVADYRREYAGAIEDAFEQHAPGTLDPSGRQARVDRASTLPNGKRFALTPDGGDVPDPFMDDGSSPIGEVEKWLPGLRNLHPDDRRIIDDVVGDRVLQQDSQTVPGYLNELAKDFDRDPEWAAEIADSVGEATGMSPRGSVYLIEMSWRLAREAADAQNEVRALIDEGASPDTVAEAQAKADRLDDLAVRVSRGGTHGASEVGRALRLMQDVGNPQLNFEGRVRRIQRANGKDLADTQYRELQRQHVEADRAVARAQARLGQLGEQAKAQAAEIDRLRKEVEVRKVSGAELADLQRQIAELQRQLDEARKATPGAKNPTKSVLDDPEVQDALGGIVADEAALTKMSVWDGILAMRKLNMLTSVLTVLRNATSNTAQLVRTEGLRPFDAAFDSAISTIYGTGVRTTIANPRAKKFAGAAKAAMQDVKADAKSIWKEGVTPDTMGGFEVVTSRRTGVRGLDWWLELGGKIQSVQDRPWFRLAFQRSLREQAMLMAKKGGDADADALIANPTEAMLAQATTDAQLAIYAPPNKMTDAASWLANKHWIGRTLLDVALPFRKVPANIGGDVLTSNPVGLLYNAQKFGKIIRENQAAAKAGDAKAQAAVAAAQKRLASLATNSATGTAMFALGVYLYGKGVLEPGRPPSSGDAGTREAADALSNSVKILGKRVAISSLHPMAMVMMTGGAYAQALEQGGRKDEESARTAEEQGFEVENVGKMAPQTAVVKAFATTLEQYPFFSGLQDIAKLVQGTTTAERYAGRVAGSFVPGVLGQARQTVAQDPSERDPRGVVEGIEYKAGLREGLAPRLDVFGRPIPTSEGFDPFQTKDVPGPRTVEAEALRLKVKMAKPKSKPGEEDPPNTRLRAVGVQVKAALDAMLDGSEPFDPGTTSMTDTGKMSYRASPRLEERLIAKGWKPDGSYWDQNDDVRRLMLETTYRRVRAKAERDLLEERLEALGR